MPSVSVIPLGGATVNSLYPGPGPNLVNEMSAKEGVRDVGSSPASRHDQDSSIQDNNLKGKDISKVDKADKKDGDPSGGPPSPVQASSHPQVLPAHLTPQQPGYYVSYKTQVTPEPPSPSGAVAYDSGSLLQPTAFHNSPFAALPPHQYGTTQQQPPGSPSQNTAGSMGGIPPASPLFPRVTGQTVGLLDQHRMFEHRGSPGSQYLSPQIVPNAGNVNEFSGWTDNRNPQNSYPPNSPQISAQGIPIPYVPGINPRAANVAGRSYSFDEMLPPPNENQQQHIDQQQGQGQNYPAYGGGQTNGPSGALFAPHQQPWGYPAGPDMYGMSASPLQPRPTMAYPGMPGGPPRHHAPHMAPYGGSYFSTTSPGPPIQTTNSNKGPDGANLFIFHIPNHFSNMDMYQLFCPYGNLLSVRIMVEKDSGRSRGFGFVSYDSPDAAALAIKELNGFAVGNKRLKVQHKQIRSADQQYERSGGNTNPGYDPSGGRNFGRGHMSSSLPPSGPMSTNPAWYNNRSAPPVGAELTRVPDTDHTDEVNPTSSSDENAKSDALQSMDPLRQSLPEVEGSPEH